MTLLKGITYFLHPYTFIDSLSSTYMHLHKPTLQSSPSFLRAPCFFSRVLFRFRFLFFVPGEQK